MRQILTRMLGFLQSGKLSFSCSRISKHQLAQKSTDAEAIKALLCKYNLCVERVFFFRALMQFVVSQKEH